MVKDTDTILSEISKKLYLLDFVAPTNDHKEQQKFMKANRRREVYKPQYKYKRRKLDFDKLNETLDSIEINNIIHARIISDLKKKLSFLNLLSEGIMDEIYPYGVPDKKMVIRAKKEISKSVVGQEEIIDTLFMAIICDGHVLLEGVPGIAKTLTVRSLAQITSTKFGRIQFTPDLLPTDILGVTIYHEAPNSKQGKFVTVKGSIFGDFILGDEINRSPPKIQSALLEAMQERQVTIGKNTFDLEKPFFVLATQNPIESVGTYPLPAAELDRFLFKVIMS